MEGAFADFCRIRRDEGPSVFETYEQPIIELVPIEPLSLPLEAPSVSAIDKLSNFF